MNIFAEIDRLVSYGISKELIYKEDEIYSVNRILEVLGLSNYEKSEGNKDINSIESILNNITKWAIDSKIIEDSIVNKDIFSTKLMAAITPRPSEVIKEFNKRYEENSKKATDYFYKFSNDTNYVRSERVKRDLKWKTKTSVGTLDITINMSKPEKDPKDIAKAAKEKSKGSYPKCLLCKECEGYAGTISYPARGNHRIIPLEINNNKWFLQYSPYVYFNEHSIVLKGEHLPMELNKDSFVELLYFIEKFPHYFIGSNADLPIVGGSILSHDHYQAGSYEFALERAEVLKKFSVIGFEDLEIFSVNWPLTVIRVRGKNKSKIAELSNVILNKWRNYSDEALEILAFTEGVPHNTITPICRFKDGLFEMDLVLRNNRTTEEYPYGIFHPHNELHHIKKENIGLIEVMGLAILPARLNKEMIFMKEFLLSEGKSYSEEIKSHLEWLKDILNRRSIDKFNVEDVIKEEIGIRFSEVLNHCAVFKLDQEGRLGLESFIATI